MIRPHETHDFLTAKAFCALCDCVKQLSRPASVALPEKMTQARLGAIRAAVSMAPDVAVGTDPLSAALAAPSVEIISALFEGPRKDEWNALLENFMARWEEGEGGIGYSINTSDSFSIAHLCYLEDLGLPLHKMTSTLGRRMLVDPDPGIDQLMARITMAQYGEPEPVLHAGHWSSTALSLMHPRHLRRLETLLHSDAADRAHACLDFLCERLVLPRDWREAALVIRIGFKPEDCLGDAPQAVLSLAEKTRSAHGRLHLIGIEPDIAEMAARGPDAPFFGLTRAELKAARTKG